jgi:hypothetical protein
MAATATKGRRAIAVALTLISSPDEHPTALSEPEPD